MPESTRGTEGFRVCPYCTYEQYVERADFDAAEDWVEECEECEKKFWARDELNPVYHAAPDCVLNGDQHEALGFPFDPPICKKCGRQIAGKEHVDA